MLLIKQNYNAYANMFEVVKRERTIVWIMYDVQLYKSFNSAVRNVAHETEQYVYSIDAKNVETNNKKSLKKF